MESDIKVDDTRAAEVGVFVHDGREYASGGFSVDVERGRMVAYVTERKGEHLTGKLWEGDMGVNFVRPNSIGGTVVTRFHLTTWQGEHLADLKRTGLACGFHGAPLECFRTVTPIAGYHWFGRGLGAGMYLRLRRGRKAGK